MGDLSHALDVARIGDVLFVSVWAASSSIVVVMSGAGALLSTIQPSAPTQVGSGAQSHADYALVCVALAHSVHPGVVPACLVLAARRTSAPVWQPTMGTSLCFPPRVETSRSAQPAPLHRPSSLLGGKVLCVQSALAWLLAPLLCLCRSSSDRAQVPCGWLSVFPMPHQSLFRKYLDVALWFFRLAPFRALTIS